MKAGFYIAVTLAALVLTNSTGLAEKNLLAPKRLMFNEKGKLEFFKTKAPKEMMSPEEFQRYDKALSGRDCKTAARILNAAFFRTYTQFRPAKTSYDCTAAEFLDCYDWEAYAHSFFKEYAFCMLNEGLRDSEKKLHQGGKTIPKFALPRFPKKRHYDNQDLRSRDEALSSLIAQADGGYVPSLEKVADLIRQGDVFSAGNDVEYYVLRRACILSTDCAKWQRTGNGLPHF